MDQQPQTEQTEKIIIEMLEFLDSSSEESEADLENVVKSSNTAVELQTVKKDFNDNILPNKNEKNANLKNRTKKEKPSLIKELQKLKQQFPVCNSKENVQVLLDDPLYCKTSASILNTNGNGNAAADNKLDWHLKLEMNCRRSCTNNSYIQEVQKAIYGDKTGHPANGSAEYYQAAQNYLETLLNEKNTSGSESSSLTNNLNNVLYPLNQGLGAIGTSVGHSNIGKLMTTSAGVITPQSCAISSGSTASSAAYYQLCNGINNHSRPPISINGINSTAYGIFLGNKVTYVAANPTAPTLLYNQHSKTTTNFISNSLANAALATSPAILYTNPMLTTTTQQYLNTFFKEAQFLGNATGLTTNSAQATALTSNGATTGLYERLIYAQILQQQLYHQTQQAAVVAAMFQHKQRAAAAAAAAIAASNRQQANAATNSNRTSPQHFNNVTSSSNIIFPKANTNTAAGSPTSSSDFIKTKQQSPTAANKSPSVVTSPSTDLENVSVNE